MYADMIYKYGYVHCDPHAGNILVNKDKNGSDEIILLDHGLYTVTLLILNLRVTWKTL
jgi:aarF domain-containing kinase